jgi:3-hydroxyisobutyrate dehydrogenase-like beta-hydroxyacid dehydrogenase
MKLLTADNAKLGFIGLGNMGSRIARRLLSHGYHLMAYDRDRAKADAVASEGAGSMHGDGAVSSPGGAKPRYHTSRSANSIAELSHFADVILSCLPDDEVVQDVYYGDAGVLANARPGTIVFEMSTVFPETSRELNHRGERHGIKVLDVAISGSTPAAEQGTVILLAGGDVGLFQVAQPLFGAISARSFHVGPAGAGTTMKLVVNTLLGVGMQAIAEAIPLGEKAGIDRSRLLDILSQTAVIAPAHVGKLYRAAQQDYSPQFPLGLMHKDFGLILKTAKSLNVQMPATNAASRVNSMELADDPNADFSAVIRRMEELSEVKPLEIAAD